MSYADGYLDALTQSLEIVQGCEPEEREREQRLIARAAIKYARELEEKVRDLEEDLRFEYAT